MQFILAVMYYILLEYHEIMLRTIILGVFLTLLLAVHQYNITGLLLAGNPMYHISVRVNRHSLLGCKYFDLIRRYLSIIFRLQGRK